MERPKTLDYIKLELENYCSFITEAQKMILSTQMYNLPRFDIS